ncbi:Transposon Ty3-I Gag-Pol polyprotein [Araneus ventricosus]|uniref:Transposon Ty3-I Gag-Pol polyprotein n=1 Tax=Araneus ventricosus TaxID=182803 RepID=A0A4Y2VM27_ARAVE|nr:Transposon Ty3-I Gag-Pol polyprotein [Araneus ventricosus]GBO25496.1 Transposon Ty3-I Gag-Pol polyprotein [Araneus ventricosus]GBO25520.1 Transposon Ty3-I Gag-Pol polyprotein [Araneus ventricosus]GBO25549.1 Transposon Ty3-I Gag-Pol polyprotein [Araneus ventricosus]
MLKEDVIKSSESSWSSPVVLVKKENSEWRFCVDYRRLNKVTKKDVYPLPRIDDALGCLAGARIFSMMDLKSGYWQVELDDKDKEKTAFVTPDGLFEFKVMPFGLCNAPATFERMMDSVLRGLKWNICLCYLNDIIVFAPNFQEHQVRLRKVLTCLQEAGLSLNSSKCCFGIKKLLILGHLVDEHGIYPDPEKVAAVEKFPIPQNIADVRIITVSSKILQTLPDHCRNY